MYVSSAAKIALLPPPGDSMEAQRKTLEDKTTELRTNLQCYETKVS